MRQFLLVFLLLTFAFSFAQKPFNLSQGKSTEKGYLTTIPYTEVKEKIIVDGIINGKTYKFILDTGAPMLIFRELSDELNLQTIKDLAVKDQSNKTDTMPTVILPKIKVGDVTFNNIPTLVSDSHLIKCFGIHGIIGSNVFRNSAVQFSSKEKTVTITDSPKRLKLKSKPSKLLLSPQSNPYIWVGHNNQEILGREQLLFDTGMAGFYDISMQIYTEHADKFSHLNVIGKSSGTFSAGLHGNADVAENYKFMLPDLTINNIEFKNIITETTYDTNSRVGAGLLKYGIVTVDYKRKKFYFDPFENKDSFDLSTKEWPFNAVMIDGKLAIGIVWDPAFEGRLKHGDWILQIDNTNFETMSECELMLISMPTIATDKATMTVKDGVTGEIRQIEITKK